MARTSAISRRERCFGASARLPSASYAYLSRNPDSSRAEMREAMPRVQDRIFNHAIDEMHRLRVICQGSWLEDERYRVTYE